MDKELIKNITNVLLRAFKLKLTVPVFPKPQDALGSISFVCKTTANMKSAPSMTLLKRLIASGNYGKGYTVEDVNVIVSPVRMCLTGKSYYVSILLVLSTPEESLESYTLSFSTDSLCLHIKPIQ